MRRLLFLFAIAAAVSAEASEYAPLVESVAIEAIHDLVVGDDARERKIPILVSIPTGHLAGPVILFSHGLGGSRRGNEFLREHWTKRGYATVFMQHPGSDDAVWQNEPPLRRLQALKAAASAENMRARVGDVGVVLDALESWHSDPTHPLYGRLSLEHVGMSGHSFGARTTQAVAGESGWSTISQHEPRVDAAVVLSPSAPKLGSPTVAFKSVKIPWLLMTGTEDVAAIGFATVDSRLAVFPALPSGSKYELVLFGAKHNAFTDYRNLKMSPRNPNHHRVIKAFTTAFWDAYLRGENAAAAWLEGTPAQNMLESGDRWQWK